MNILTPCCLKLIKWSLCFKNFKIFYHATPHGRPHLDYGDVVYDKVFNESFHKKLESVQWEAVLAMTVAIRGTNTEKLYKESGLELSQNRRKLPRLGLFYKIYKHHTLPYLRNLIPKSFQSSYSLRATTEIPLFRVKHAFFKRSFFLSTIIELE